VIGAIVAVALAIAVLWRTHRRVEVVETPAVTEHVVAPASRSDARLAGPRIAHTEAERQALLEAIATARSRRAAMPPAPAPRSHGTTAGTDSTEPTATTLDIVDRTGDNSAWSKRALATINQLFGQCYDLGRAEDPNLEGTLVLRFTLAGEPGVGGLLERVDIIDDNSTITQATIRDCMKQQLYALELDPPPDGVRIEREISLKF